jgi:TolB-like protein/DNA-binding SARP family transcriptional activator
MNGDREPSVVNNVNTAQNRRLQSDADSSGLQIRMLGPMTITNDGKPVTIGSKKGRALIGYLALREGVQVPRTVLAGLVWGERSESQARASLRQTLSELRSALDEPERPSIVATKDAVAWVGGSAWIDAAALETSADSHDGAVLKQAAELFRGDLMEGLSIDEPAFEQWLAGERERFRLMIGRVHTRLMDQAEHDGRLAEALMHGLKLLSLDPLQEHVHRALMRLYAAQGRHDAALAQYERCRRELSDQLRVQPDDETERLARSIRASRRDRPEPPVMPVAGLEDEAGRRTAVLDPRSVAVLPFTNLGGDPDQQYLGDGIAEDIITELSRYRSLLVIARNSCFQFRGPIDHDAIRHRLGVQYVVEGSIRKIGSRLRLAVQLIDAETERNVWAERYDHEADETFAVQDEMTRSIAATLEGRVLRASAERAKRSPTTSWVAYDYFLQGRERVHQDDWPGAEPYLRRAIELDSGYAQPHALRVCSLLGKYWIDPDIDTRQEALDSAARALSLDATDPWCQAMMGFALSHGGQRAMAGPFFDRAVGLNPGDVHMKYWQAWWLARNDRAAEALEMLDLAMKRDPFPPTYFWGVRMVALLVLRRYDEVIGAIARKTYLAAWDHAYVAACHAYMNRDQEARAAASRVLKMDPKFTVTRYGLTEGYKSASDLRHLLDGMRMAHLPE